MVDDAPAPLRIRKNRWWGRTRARGPNEKGLKLPGDHPLNKIMVQLVNDV